MSVSFKLGEKLNRSAILDFFIIVDASNDLNNFLFCNYLDGTLET